MKRKKSFTDHIIGLRGKKTKSSQSISYLLNRVLITEEVEYINAARATDLITTKNSLNSIYKPIIWIIGSANFDGGYQLLEPLIRYKVKGIILLGRKSRKAKSIFSSWVGFIEEYQELNTAVARAREISVPGDAVLFSPVLSDVEDIGNPKELGQAFVEEVKRI